MKKVEWHVEKEQTVNLHELKKRKKKENGRRHSSEQSIISRAELSHILSGQLLSLRAITCSGVEIFLPAVTHDKRSAPEDLKKDKTPKLLRQRPLRRLQHIHGINSAKQYSDGDWRDMPPTDGERWPRYIWRYCATLYSHPVALIAGSVSTGIQVMFNTFQKYVDWRHWKTTRSEEHVEWGRCGVRDMRSEEHGEWGTCGVRNMRNEEHVEWGTREVNNTQSEEHG